MKLLKLTLLIGLLPLFALGQTDSTTLTKVGDKLPEFSFELEKGKTVKIGDYKGKLVLINFFATSILLSKRRALLSDAARFKQGNF